jgi:hypothetical protein
MRSKVLPLPRARREASTHARCRPSSSAPAGKVRAGFRRGLGQQPIVTSGACPLS